MVFEIKKNRKQRRKEWEPFVMKELRNKLRCVLQDSKRAELTKRLWKARVDWAAEKEKLQKYKDFRKRKFVWKKKKTYIHKIYT